MVEMDPEKYSWGALRERPLSSKIQAFLREIVEVCCRHKMSLAHEDQHGCFIVERYSEHNIQWLLDADDDTRSA